MIINSQDTTYRQSVERVKRHTVGRDRHVYIYTFGCQQNEADSERILAMAEEMGYARTDTADNADLIVINTCAIRAHAEEKALSMLGTFKSIKKKDPELIVGVCGCMAAESGVVDMLKKDFHYVSFTIEPNMLHEMPQIIADIYDGGGRCFVIGRDEGNIVEGIAQHRASRRRAWVSIMYGCNNFCTYCIVPYVRGRERSRSSADIIDECRRFVADGCREITLLGQNVNSYRSDVTFAGLVRRIAEIDGDFIIRFMTSHPKDVSDELIEVMAQLSPKVAPYFHLPLQSGSDEILKKMNRTYDSARFIDVASRLKASVPGIALSTDVIVGFPSETEEDFRSTLDVLSAVRFDMVYAFAYSPREGTPAARMDCQIPKEVKNERLSRLLAMQDEISLAESRGYIGSTQRVLVESVSRRSDMATLAARTASNKLVHFVGDKSLVGEFVDVRITDAGVYDLTAELI